MTMRQSLELRRRVYEAGGKDSGLIPVGILADEATHPTLELSRDERARQEHLGTSYHGDRSKVAGHLRRLRPDEVGECAEVATECQKDGPAREQHVEGQRAPDQCPRLPAGRRALGASWRHGEPDSTNLRPDEWQHKRSAAKESRE